MKLYATTTSERASKGQGGNKWLNIDLLVGDVKNQIQAGRVALREEQDCFYIDYYEPNKEEGYNLLTIWKTKGEKLKTAICGHGIDKDKNCLDCTQY